MLFDLIENYLVVAIIGIIIGILITRNYYERTKSYSIGKAIEGAMISDSIQVLIDNCKDLGSLLSKMNLESENLLDHINRCGDMNHAHIYMNLPKRKLTKTTITLTRRTRKRIKNNRISYSSVSPVPVNSFEIL